MSEDTKETIGVMLLCLFFLCFGSSLSKLGNDWSWRRQIAGHHCAEFYIDGHNYRQWRWLDCNKQ